MENLAKLLEAIATLLWPILAVVLCVFFRSPIASVIKSWAWRKSTLKLGDLEISIEDYNQQQRDLIGDLQEKIIQLEEKISFPNLPLHSDDSKVGKILWVDDHPENHVQIIETLTKNGVKISQSLTTLEAITSLSNSDFDLIITDMHRIENGKIEVEAGMELIRQVRKENNMVPIVVYFGRSKKPMFRYREVALSAGANLVTASPTELISVIEKPNKLSQRDAASGAPA